MFANSLKIHHNYMLDYKEAMLLDMMYKMISRKYLNNNIHSSHIYNIITI